MTIASTGFMAAPGGFSATLSNKLDKIDCSQVLSAVLKGDKQLLGHVRMGPTAHNIEVNWIEDELNPAYILCSSSSSTTATAKFSSVAGGYSTASLQRILRKNAILQPAGKEFVFHITASVTKSTMTGAIYGSTTWASWTMTKCFIVGMPYADIDAASSDISVSRPKRRNFMQVFERAVEITQTRKGMDMEAIVDELQLQIKRRTMELKREFDIAIQRGYAVPTGSSGYTADNELRTMAGIIQLLRDPNLDTTNEDTTVTQASAALTVGLINSLAYKIWDAGGLDETADPIIVVGAKQQRVIAGFEKDLRRVEQGERTFGYYRDIFLSDMGVEMPVVLDRWTPEDKLIILDRSRISLRPMAGDAWHMEKMAKTGRNEKWQLSGQYTLDLRNADACHGMLYDLS
jgi:hypothetical protein